MFSHQKKKKKSLGSPEDIALLFIDIALLFLPNFPKGLSPEDELGSNCWNLVVVGTIGTELAVDHEEGLRPLGQESHTKMRNTCFDFAQFIDAQIIIYKLLN